MKLIYICSPLRGDIENNLRKANRYCEYAMNCGMLPIAPHLAWSGFLDDNDPVKREKALMMGLALLEKVDEVWVFGNRVSQGMQGEIEAAARLGKPVRYVLDEAVELRQMTYAIPSYSHADCGELEL